MYCYSWRIALLEKYGYTSTQQCALNVFDPNNVYIKQQIDSYFNLPSPAESSSNNRLRGKARRRTVLKRFTGSSYPQGSLHGPGMAEGWPSDGHWMIMEWPLPLDGSRMTQDVHRCALAGTWVDIRIFIRMGQGWAQKSLRSIKKIVFLG